MRGAGEHVQRAHGPIAVVRHVHHRAHRAGGCRGPRAAQHIAGGVAQQCGRAPALAPPPAVALTLARRHRALQLREQAGQRDRRGCAGVRGSGQLGLRARGPRAEAVEVRHGLERHAQLVVQLGAPHEESYQRVVAADDAEVHERLPHRALQHAPHSSLGAGRQYLRGPWVKACSPARHIAAGALGSTLRCLTRPHTHQVTPGWGVAGTPSQPQQAQEEEAPLMLLFSLVGLGHPAPEPATYVVDDLRGQEPPSGALRPHPARPACLRAQLAPCCAAQGKDGKGTSCGGLKRAARGHTPYPNTSAT